MVREGPPKLPDLPIKLLTALIEVSFEVSVSLATK